MENVRVNKSTRLLNTKIIHMTVRINKNNQNAHIITKASAEAKKVINCFQSNK